MALTPGVLQDAFEDNPGFFQVSGSFTSGDIITWHWGDGSSDDVGAPTGNSSERAIVIFHQYPAIGKYTLTVSTSGGPSGVQSANLDVGVQIDPTFQYTPTTVGAPIERGQDLTFSTLFPDPADGRTYHYDFGDGDTADPSDGIATHTFASGGGNIDVVLTVTAPSGSDALVDSPVTSENTDFITDIDGNYGWDNFSDYPNVTFTADNALGTGYTYEWDFGDGSPHDTTSGPVVTHAYTDGFYDVVFTITRLSDSVTNSDTETLKVHPPFDTTFTYDQLDPSTLEITFQANVTDPDAIYFFWSFGDDLGGVNTDNITNPTYTYDASGTYSVTLNVDDDYNGSESTQDVIVAAPASIADFTIDASPYYNGAAIGFHVTDTRDSSYDYTFDYGDTVTEEFLGTGDPFDTDHTYDTCGPFTITLTVLHSTDDPVVISQEITVMPNPSFAAATDDGPPVEAPVLYDFNHSFPVDGAVYTWFFGDGNLDNTSGYHVTYTYLYAGTYTVQCFVDLDGVGETVESHTITFGGDARPVAVLNADPISGASPLTVTVDGLDSTGVDLTYDFDYGDGSSHDTTVGPQTHVYTDDGDFTITLTVTDTNSTTDFTQAFITVGVLMTPPTASFNTSPESGDIPLVVSFDASASSDLDGTIVTYDWDFGDGNTESDSIATTTHTYTVAGEHTVVLTVTDNDALTDTQTGFVTANGPPSLVFVDNLVHSLRGPSSIVGTITAQNDGATGILIIGQGNNLGSTFIVEDATITFTFPPSATVTGEHLGSVTSGVPLAAGYGPIHGEFWDITADNGDVISYVIDGLNVGRAVYRRSVQNFSDGHVTNALTINENTTTDGIVVGWIEFYVHQTNN